MHTYIHTYIHRYRQNINQAALLALFMGTHHRLGAQSPILQLDASITAYIANLCV